MTDRKKTETVKAEIVYEPSLPITTADPCYKEVHETFAQLRAGGLDGKGAYCKANKKKPSDFCKSDERKLRMWETNAHMMERIDYLRRALIITNDGNAVTKPELVGMLSTRIRMEYNVGKTQDFVILAKMIADLCGFNVPARTETTIKAYVEKSDEELRRIIEGK